MTAAGAAQIDTRRCHAPSATEPPAAVVQGEVAAEPKAPESAATNPMSIDSMPDGAEEMGGATDSEPILAGAIGLPGNAADYPRSHTTTQ